MKINILFIPSNHDFTSKDKSRIKSLLNKHAEKAVLVLEKSFKDQKQLTFTFYPWQKEGISAFTKTTDWIRIMINPDQLQSPAKRLQILDQLTYIAYHETHHACRGYVGYLPKGKEHLLIASMISEGLADQFAKEMHPSNHVLKTTSFDFEEIKSWLPKLNKIKWQKESLDDSWMYGDTGKPRLLGYKIGRYIIQTILEKNPGLNSIKLVKTSAEKILKLSQIKK